MARFLRQHALIVGLVLMFLFTWPIDLGTAAYTRGLIDFQVPEIAAILVGYGIVIGTVLATLLVSGRSGLVSLLRRFLIWRVWWGWYAVALLLVPVLMLLSIGLRSLFAQTMPDFSQTFARELFGSDLNPWLLVLPFFVFSMLTNGEEIGWRGYVLPRLQKQHSALAASLILGAIWAFWHLPKYLMVDTTLGGGRGMDAFFIESAKIVAHAILFTWLFNNTKGSLLLATLFHASFNASWVFLPMQNLGIADLVIYWVAAVLVVVLTGQAQMVRRPKEVPVVAVEPGSGEI